MGELENLRRKVDSIDSQIISLLKKRLSLAIKILKAKKKKKMKVYQPDREKKILQKVTPKLRPIFKEIIRQTRKLQAKRWK